MEGSWRARYEEEVQVNKELGRRIEIWKKKCAAEFAHNARLAEEKQTLQSKYDSVIRNPANVKLGTSPSNPMCTTCLTHG